MSEIKNELDTLETLDTLDSQDDEQNEHEEQSEASTGNIVTDILRGVVNYVAEHPIQTIGGVAVTGLAGKKIMDGRKARKEQAEEGKSKDNLLSAIAEGRFKLFYTIPKEEPKAKKTRKRKKTEDEPEKAKAEDTEPKDHTETEPEKAETNTAKKKGK